MADFEVARSRTIAAPPERIHGLIDDFHQWRSWSPWEDVDPDLQRDYSGAQSGEGARYAWEGNRKAGKGNMEIVDSKPDHVEVRLTFEKPWKATNRVVFQLAPEAQGTEVTWRMYGEHKGVMKVLSKVMSMDRMVGKDFEKGLDRLKRQAESG